jgi:hypothetical protein
MSLGAFPEVTFLHTVVHRGQAFSAVHRGGCLQTLKPVGQREFDGELQLRALRATVAFRDLSSGRFPFVSELAGEPMGGIQPQKIALPIDVAAVPQRIDESLPDFVLHAFHAGGCPAQHHRRVSDKLVAPRVETDTWRLNCSTAAPAARGPVWQPPAPDG